MRRVSLPSHASHAPRSGVVSHALASASSHPPLVSSHVARSHVAAPRAAHLVPQRSEVPRRQADAMVAINRLLQPGRKPRDVFHRLVQVLDRAIGVRAVAIHARSAGDQPLVWCKRRRGMDRDSVDAVLGSSKSYFERREDGAEVLTTSDHSWISLPVVRGDGLVIGLVAVAPTVVPVDESAVTLVASVARHLAAMLGHDDTSTDAVAEPPAPADAMATAQVTEPLSTLRQTAFDLTAPLVSGFEYETSFRNLARLVSSRVACGCALDFYENDSNELRRIGHVPSHAEMNLTAALAPLVAQVVRRGQAATAAAPPGSADEEAEDDAAIARKTRSATAERTRRRLGMDWVVCVPLATSNGVLGTMTFMGTRMRHAPVSLTLAEELGRRAGAALENARLYHGAVNALEARERVLAMVSHDLKNPLGVILMGASRILEQTPVPERRSAGRREIEAILRSARRMKNLISDLLDLSVIDSGGLALRPSEVDLRALVRDLVADLELQASASGISLDVDLPANMPKVWADPDRISQVITNLTSNSLKFTHRGGAVRVQVHMLEGDEVEISVCDDGPGIRPDDLPRIFDRFWQAPETAMKGTGLGLAICKTIVEQSGGRIRASSHLGRGTTMAFTLATSNANAVGPTVASTRPSVRPSSAPSAPKIRGRRGNGMLKRG